MLGLVLFGLVGLSGCTPDGRQGDLQDWCRNPDAILRAPGQACPLQASTDIPKPIGRCGTHQWAVLPERADAINQNHFFYTDGVLVGVSLIGDDHSARTPYFGERPIQCEPCVTAARSRLPKVPVCP